MLLLFYEYYLAAIKAFIFVTLNYKNTHQSDS